MNLFQRVIQHQRFDWWLKALVPYRLVLNVILHTLIFMLSYAYAVVLLNGMTVDTITINIYTNTILPLLVIRLAVFYWHDLFFGIWQYVSFEDLINIVRAVVISSLLFYLLGLIWAKVCVSEELYILDMTFCLLFTGGIRTLVRNFRERFFRIRSNRSFKRALLVGSLDNIQPILKDFIGNPQSHYLPVAVVDPLNTGVNYKTRICDVPVVSLSQIVRNREHYRSVDEVVFCWPGSSSRLVDAVVEQLKPLGLTFKTIPHVEEILDNRVRFSDIREIEIEDLLERPSVHIDMEQISTYLKGKTILVTGGGGSIGSEICRQVAGFQPRQLVVVERSENSLYDLILEFNRDFPDISFSAVISSVNDGKGLETIMRAHQADVVFHAAAYKHVPLMEPAPVESAYNNIVGTYNTAKAAIAAGVKRFVMISTDKAVNPANVMGVTKRIAEMIVQSHNTAATRFMTVRFGNVLGSAGSVIPIFKRQIIKGQPVTVTHPDIERFFMTIPEAVQLVLQAGCLDEGGGIFVLDMGEPVRILHLAEKLITLSGKRPYEDVEIIFTGLRPGEKMYEELFNDYEKLRSTPHPRIRVAVSQDVESGFIEDQISRISALIQNRDVDGLLKKFHELVPGYHCPESVESALSVCRSRADCPVVQFEKNKTGPVASSNTSTDNKQFRQIKTVKSNPLVEPN